MFAAIIPFCAAVLQAASFTCDKAILNIRRIGYRMYLAVSFPMLAAADALFWLIVRPPLTRDMLVSQTGLLVFISIGVIIVTNVLYYRALKDDDLSEINILSLTSAIPVILVNSLLFSDERRVAVIIPAMVAAVAVVWAHWEHHRLSFKRHTPAFLFWLWFTTPLMAAAGKIILTVWNPISLELVRDATIALVLTPLFISSVRRAPNRGWWLLVATNVLSSAAWILYFLSYQRLGIIYTVLIFSLQPLLVYLAGVLILKEPFVPRKFLAFLVVLASIAAAQVLK